MFLQTPRLNLRPFQLPDYSHVHAHHHSTIEPQPNHETSLFDELELFMYKTDDEPIKKQIRIALVLQKNQELIGDIIVTYRQQSLALSFDTQLGFQRQGYMREALLSFLPYLQQRYPTLDIICLVPKNNQAVQRLLENLDFKKMNYLSNLDCHLYMLKNS